MGECFIGGNIGGTKTVTGSYITTNTTDRFSVTFPSTPQILMVMITFMDYGNPIYANRIPPFVLDFQAVEDMAIRGADGTVNIFWQHLSALNRWPIKWNAATKELSWYINALGQVGDKVIYTAIF